MLTDTDIASGVMNQCPHASISAERIVHFANVIPRERRFTLMDLIHRMPPSQPLNKDSAMALLLHGMEAGFVVECSEFGQEPSATRQFICTAHPERVPLFIPPKGWDADPLIDAFHGFTRVQENVCPASTR